MMKRADRIAELFRDIDHLRHFVGAIAMVVNQNVSAQNFSESFQTEVTRRRIALVRRIPRIPLPAIAFGQDPRGAVTGDVTHAR